MILNTFFAWPDLTVAASSVEGQHPCPNPDSPRSQCDYIAQGIGQVIGIDVHTRCIERAVDTDTQTHKSQMERWKNTEGIFQITDATAVSSKHILIVDDVATTGATLHACVSTLLKVPNVRVSIFALTKTAE